MAFYDAHNHLHDERLLPHLDSILDQVKSAGVARMVVNGSCEDDWPTVLAVARRSRLVLASFGYHPWYVNERSTEWRSGLRKFLQQVPSAIGEIGLDRWIKDFDPVAQDEVFVWQMQLAVELDLPVTIHCLQAWGRLLEILKSGPCPRAGFVLHSYGGSREMIAPLAELGAYFSLPGYFAHERKARQREVFKHVPLDRLLIETDAPDQVLPPERDRYLLEEGVAGKVINHPANLPAVYELGAELLGRPLEEVTSIVEANFLRLFGRLCCDQTLP